MARENIEVQVVGLDQLRALNTAHTAYEKHLEKLKTLAGEAGGVTATFTSSINAQTAATQKNAAATKAVTDENAKLKQQLAQVRSETEKTTAGFGNLFKQAIQYRAISLLFHDVVKAVGEITQAYLDLEHQTSRVMRVMDDSVGRGGIRTAISQGYAQYGVSMQQSGEAAYQIASFQKDPSIAAKNLDDTLKLLVATETDAREGARTAMMMYNLFGGQMKDTSDESEKFRRMTELLAVAFKNTQTEVTEMSQSLKYVGSAAHAAGVPANDLVTILGLLDYEGQRNSTSGTGLANVMSNIFKRAVDTEGAMRKLYVTTKDGGLDLLRTLQNVAAAYKLVVEDQGLIAGEQFLKSLFPDIRGSRQVKSFIAAIGDIGQTVGKKLAEDSANAYAGKTKETGKIFEKGVNDIGTQMRIAWQGSLANMLTDWTKFADSIHLTGFFKDYNQLQSVRARLNSPDKSVRDAANLEAIQLYNTGGHISGPAGIFFNPVRGLPYWQQQQDSEEMERANRAAAAYGATQRTFPGTYTASDTAYNAAARAAKAAFDREQAEERAKEQRKKDMAEAARLRDLAKSKFDEASLISETARDEKRYLTKAEIAKERVLVEEAQGYYARANTLSKSARSPQDLTGKRLIRQALEYNTHLEEHNKEGLHRYTKFMSGAKDHLAKIIQEIIERDTKEAHEGLEARRSFIKGMWTDPAISSYGLAQSRIQRESQAGMFGADDFSEKTRDIEKSKEALTLLIARLKQVGEDTTQWKDKLADLDADLVRLKDSKMSSDFDVVMESTGKLIELMVAPGAGKRAQDIADAKERQEEYDRLRDSVKQKTVDLGMQFYHGDIGVKGIAKGLGDMIVESALEKQIAKFADPLISAMTNQIASTQGLTESTDALNATMGGNVPAGHSAGGSSGSSGKAMDLGMQKAMKYASAGLAGYSIFSEGQSHGITLGNAIGGAAAGASIGAGFGPGGALIGAGIGLGLDLLGGLFHKASNNPQNKQPAFYNTPSDFVYEAYRERATGKASTAFNAHQVQTNVPVVNVYIDSVKKEVRTQIEHSTSSGRIAMVNTRVDMHSII